MKARQHERCDKQRLERVVVVEAFESAHNTEARRRKKKKTKKEVEAHETTGASLTSEDCDRGIKEVAAERQRRHTRNTDQRVPPQVPTVKTSTPRDATRPGVPDHRLQRRSRTRTHHS